MKSESDRDIKHIEMAFTDSSRCSKCVFREKIKKSFQAINDNRRAQLALQAASSDPDGESDEDGVSDSEDEGGENKAASVSSPVNASVNFIPVKLSPLCDCNGARPSDYEHEHPFNVKNINQHLMLVNKLLTSSKDIHDKLSTPKKMTRTEANAFSFVDVETIVKLLVSSGKLEILELLPVLQAYEKERPVSSRVAQLRKLRAILMEKNPFKFPDDKKELLLPLVMFRQIQLSNLGKLPCLIPTINAEKVVGFYMIAYEATQRIGIWEKVYKIIDGMDLKPSSDYQGLALQYDLAEAALADNMQSYAGIHVEDMGGVITKLEKVIGPGLRAKNPTDLLGLCQHVSVDSASYKYPYLTVFQVLFRHGVATPDRAVNDGDAMFVEGGFEEYAAEVPQKAVRDKFGEVVGKVTEPEQIKALGVVSIDRFGFCPPELLKRYESCSGCCSGANEVDKPDPLVAIQALVYDRDQKFYNAEDVEQRIKLHGTPSSYNNWWPFLQELGFEKQAAFSRYSTDRDRFWSGVTTWVNKTAFAGFNADIKERNWQTYGLAMQKIDREKARDILRGVWFASYKKLGSSMMPCPEVLLMEPSKGQLGNAGPFCNFHRILFDAIQKHLGYESRGYPRGDLILQNIWLRFRFLPVKAKFEVRKIVDFRNHYAIATAAPFYAYGKDFIQAVLHHWVEQSDSLWIDALVAMGELTNACYRGDCTEKGHAYDDVSQYLRETVQNLPRPPQTSVP